MEASRHLKALARFLGTWKFDGKDPFQKLDSQSRLAEEADLNQMNELLASAILPQFLEYKRKYTSDPLVRHGKQKMSAPIRRLCNTFPTATRPQQQSSRLFIRCLRPSKSETRTRKLTALLYVRLFLVAVISTVKPVRWLYSLTGSSQRCKLSWRDIQNALHGALYGMNILCNAFATRVRHFACVARCTVNATLRSYSPLNGRARDILFTLWRTRRKTARNPPNNSCVRHLILDYPDVNNCHQVLQPASYMQRQTITTLGVLDIQNIQKTENRFCLLRC